VTRLFSALARIGTAVITVVFPVTAGRFEERSRNLALDFPHCRALLVLAQNEGVTQQRLSELTAIAPPWLGCTLDRLEALGLAERRHRLADRRVRSLFITEKTKVLLPMLRNFLDESRISPRHSSV
jgi:MarR family transcriptional regulator, transcriptional regulator for hemolysin